ncbi:fatty acid desaturase family protein [Paludisphaera mucosa]|uniref:Fatty acid desaturase n=1 Tax=Paludisphaera mucosa TaxID=3030827 RepID=A0ABT6FJN9_9BACT|nr:fatty acid desaturase [Paludisphaera mucosa]MDG3007759.1 fatty acid desaturase [Paludisphaera mucosa]
MNDEVSHGAAFNDPGLNARIMRLRSLDNVTNLAFLAKEYLGVAVVAGAAVLFCERREGWGLAWAWDVPVVAAAIVLIGGLQHRLAGLGHEASHYTLLKNKTWNDLVGDLFCMFPILATVRLYRAFHLAHHRYTNDPERDPDLVLLGESKRVDQFPMTRGRFIREFYLRPLTDPLAFLKYQHDYVDVTVLGRPEDRPAAGTAEPGRHPSRLGTTLGWAYVVATFAAWGAVAAADRPIWNIYLGLAGTFLVLAVGAALPERAFLASSLRQPISARHEGMLRLVHYTWCLAALGLLHGATDGRSTTYFILLWMLPMSTSFFYFMLLRDVYQHTNADDGRLTNTRVFVVDPFTRWAVFVYGQDMHLPHHLFPGVPHYRLPQLHGLLKASHAAYATQAVECHGTFANRKGMPTILDELTAPRP